MKAIKFFAFLVVLAFASSLAAQTPAPVRTQGGLVQGMSENGLTVYLGIPFAAPPVGDLRWRDPQPAAPWKEVRQADKFAPACVQSMAINRALGIEPFPVSEDCLYLDVWTPAKSPRDRLAVMVWIYGGGFTSGATSIPAYNGGNLARKGVVVVSVSYRVGELGFLAHSELSAENKGRSGNYGLLDQIAGLQWVKRNIAAFGGDPNRVTIFGESAGGISVSMLAASPLAKGLFRGAISESGGSFAPARLSNEGGENVPPLAVAERNGATFLSKLGASSIAEARKVSADDILKASGPGLGGSWPNFDGYVLPGDQYKLYEAGHYNDTPVLIGTNADEGALFVATATAAAYTANVRTGYGDYADKILAAYPAASDAEALRSSRDLFRDAAFAWNTWSWARLQSRTSKGKVYVYYFSHRPNYPDMPQFKSWGAAHGSEIAFVFGNFSKASPATDADNTVSEELSSYWVNFAKSGDPNGSGLPSWPLFTDANQQVMNLDDPSKAVPVPNLDKLKVLDGYYAWRRSQAAAKP
ncbi:MAG TPA: carboxylesterase family protein [Candidatus Acidoferrales bacterium]|nr:carboxylesterase family protein [Candidatus Acidoferrales bacterium]